MVIELHNQNLAVLEEEPLKVYYKGKVVGEFLVDLFIENEIIVELKSVENILPVHKAQLLSYMKLLDIPAGLLINFHEEHLKNGITRLILPGANQ